VVLGVFFKVSDVAEGSEKVGLDWLPVFQIGSEQLKALLSGFWPIQAL
jgi:hypothetical protein